MFEAVGKWFSRVLSRPAGADLGAHGENLAAKFLRTAGLTILARNYKCRSGSGEVDIVARDGRTIVFVEVKTRLANDDSPEPEDQVNPGKQRYIARAADDYLSRFGKPLPPVRFDVVAIVIVRNSDPIIRHHPDAFAKPH